MNVAAVSDSITVFNALSNMLFVSDASSVMTSFAAVIVVDEDDLLANIEMPSDDVPPSTAAPKMNLLSAILAVSLLSPLLL